MSAATDVIMHMLESLAEDELPIIGKAVWDALAARRTPAPQAVEQAEVVAADAVADAAESAKFGTGA